MKRAFRSIDRDVGKVRATQTLHLRVEEFVHLGEFDDLIELAIDLRLAHPQDRPVQVNVLAPG